MPASHIGQPIKLSIDDTILIFLRDIILKGQIYNFLDNNADYSLIINVDETSICMNLPLESTITNKG